MRERERDFHNMVLNGFNKKYTIKSINPASIIRALTDNYCNTRVKNTSAVASSDLNLKPCIRKASTKAPPVEHVIALPSTGAERKLRKWGVQYCISQAALKAFLPCWTLLK